MLAAMFQLGTFNLKVSSQQIYITNLNLEVFIEMFFLLQKRKQILLVQKV